MNLFNELNLGDLTLKNRIIMAPMTRCRAVDDHVPNDLMATYYAQRASAGLIITEATQVDPKGIGYPFTPGIHDTAQVEGWKKITKAVHENGGRIFLQLWHVGRVSHSSFLDGDLPVAPSAIKPAGQHYTPKGMQDFETPRELSIEEIQNIVELFRKGAINAMEAGFDGVEIHGANGYLIDQFLKDNTNKREDAYGGNIENRTKFLFEIIDAVIKEVGAERTGLRLSPGGTFNDMKDSNPKEHFQYICKKLNNYKLAYLHTVKTLDGDLRHGGLNVELKDLRDAYDGILITCGEYTKETGSKVLQENLADAIAYGALYTSNPDLVERFQNDYPLAPIDTNTYYTQDEIGYTTFEPYYHEKIA